MALIELNRPEALNALCSDLMAELGSALKTFSADKSIGAVVITGSQKSFAGTREIFAINDNGIAGADIAEMSKRGFAENYSENFLGDWEAMFASFPKPIIAAVNGYAVHGIMLISLKTVAWWWL